MKRRYLVLPLALLTAFAAFGGVQALAKEGEPAPTAGKVLAEDLQDILGATVGPDGALYVAEAGTSGTQKIATPNGDGFFGLSARISRIDPTTGARTTVATNIPSGSGSSNGPGFGIADVTFLNGQLHYLLSSNLREGFPAYPNGIYHINKDGSSKLVADISTFNDEHPVTFPDAIPGGNPFGITVLNGDFYVTDGNYNRVLHITLDGKINIVSSFDNVVPTGITGRDGGPLIITEFGSFPFAPEQGKVIQVGVPTGTQVELAGGFSHIISVAYGPGGQLYALSMGDQAPSGDPVHGVPFTGKILRVNADGTLTPVVDGLLFATSLDFSGDTAYVTSLKGMVYQITDFSTIKPPAPVPAAPAPPPAKPAAVTAPNTGTGSAAGGGSWLTALLIVGITGVALVVAGTRTIAGREATSSN